MDKKNRNILMAIFLAIFLIPELLWLSVSSVFLSFLDIYHMTRDTWLDNVSTNVVSVIIAIQTVSISGLTVILFRLIRKKPALILLAIICGVVSIISLFVFLISISLRNIGF